MSSFYDKYYDEFFIPDDMEDLENLELVFESSNPEKSIPSYMANVIMHMMKFKFQSDRQTKSWMHSIANSYKKIMLDCKKYSYNKILKILLLKEVWIYKAAIKGFIKDTGIKNIKTVPDSLHVEILMSGKKYYILKFIEIWGFPENAEFSKTLDYGC